MDLGDNKKNCGVISQVLEDWSGKDWQKHMANDLCYLNYYLEVEDETQLIYKNRIQCKTKK